jgi:porphobilinogen synthase
MRRNRKADWSRRLVRESALTTDDLIWPIFVMDGAKPAPRSPGCPASTALSRKPCAAAEAAALGIPAIAPFPYVDKALRDPTGSEALNTGNLMCRAVRAIKRGARDRHHLRRRARPLHLHGHDGVMEGGASSTTPASQILVGQALAHADAGADVIAPSDMMDGRIGAIRAALDGEGHEDVQIMAYAAKYASAFYGPFRDAIGTNATLVGDKRTYQMDPANSDEAIAR